MENNSYKIPKNLKHMPLILLEEYYKIDGQRSLNCKGIGEEIEKCTDAKGLSIGISQWSDDELAGKVWRNTKNRWSRQSEELPLNRILDLAILTCKTIQISSKEESYQPNTFKSQEEKQLKIDINEEATKRDLDFLYDNFSKYTEEDDKIIYPRLKELKRILDEIL